MKYYEIRKMAKRKQNLVRERPAERTVIEYRKLSISDSIINSLSFAFGLFLWIAINISMLKFIVSMYGDQTIGAVLMVSWFFGQGSIILKLIPSVITSYSVETLERDN